VQIASAGRGFEISWRHFQLAELIQIASAAGQGRGALTITDAEDKPVAQVTQVASAGRGAVVFAPDA